MIRRAVLPAAVALGVHLAAPASAQLLPETGTTADADGLRPQLEKALATGAQPATTTPGWTLLPSISVQESWTNQPQAGSQSSSGSAFITMIRPGLLVNGDSSRIKATVNYAPDLQFGTGGTQTLIGQNLNATTEVTFIPDQLFLDLRGFGALQATSGGYGPNGTVALGAQNMTQSYSFSATPYLREQFGDFGTAELGASVAYTSLQGLQNSQALLALSNSADQSSTTERGYLSFTSGPDFGRYQAVILLSAQQSQGTGVMNGASRDIASIDNGFAVTRSFTLLGKFGYQSIAYGGIPPFRYDGGLWNAGFRWAPNADSSIEFRYGRNDGRDSPWLKAAYAPTVRTRIFASYSEGLSTDQEMLAAALNAAVLDPLGNPTDPQTGAPLLLTSNFFGVQNNVAWVKTASLTGMLVLDRDVVSLSLSHLQRRQVAAANLASAGNVSSTSTYGSVTWQHDLGPALKSLSFVQYGGGDNVFIITGTQNFNSLVLSQGLTYALSETLSGSVQYSYTSGFTTGPASSSGPISLVFLNVRKNF